jgi:hypothetical protein
VSDVTPQLGGNLDTNGNDINFGDNDKAIFGAGSDLQIYHDTLNSVISDQGTGNLVIAADDFRLTNSSQTANMIKADDTGAVTLTHNGANKLATTSTGIDVTGTATMDGLAVETGSGNTYPAVSTSADELVITNKTASTPAGITIFSDNASQGNIFFGDEQDADAGRIVYDHNGNANALSFYANGTLRQKIDGSTGDISFYEDTGTTAKFFWDASAESLGIGTSSPSAQLHLQAPAGTASIQKIYTGSSAGAATLKFGQIGSVGWDTGITASSGNYQVAIEGGQTAYDITRSGSSISNHVFYTGGSERMRIDSSGNLLVGTTNITPSISGVEGIALSAGSYGGRLEACRDSGGAASFGRLTSDGEIVDFKKDGSTVGKIGAVSGKIYIGSSAGGDTFLRLNSNTVTPANSSGADRDATINLGYSGGRFQNLFLSGGVYLGGTGSANHLDDYEEGTWTPTITGSTTAGSYSQNLRTGRYTKIGNMVYVHCSIVDVSIVSAGSGNFTITGLPFTCRSDQYRNIAAFRLRQANFGRDNLFIAIGEGSTIAYPSYANDGGNAANLTTADLANGTDFGFTLVYEVA